MTEMGQPATTPGQSAGATAATSAITDLLTPFQAEARATRLAIEDRNRSQRRTSQWLIAFVAVTAVLVILVLWMLVRDGQRRAQSREIIRNNAELSAQIADCTRADGVCYQENQRKVRIALERLVEQDRAIAICAKQTDTEADLDACVAKRVKPLPTAAP